MGEERGGSLWLSLSLSSLFPYDVSLWAESCSFPRGKTDVEGHTHTYTHTHTHIHTHTHTEPARNGKPHAFRLASPDALVVVLGAADARTA